MLVIVCHKCGGSVYCKKDTTTGWIVECGKCSSVWDYNVMTQVFTELSQDKNSGK